MKQLSSLLSKLINKDTGKYLVRGNRIDCPMTKLDGPVAVIGEGGGLTPVSWLSPANLALLSKGAELVIENDQHFIRSVTGANVLLPPAEDDDGNIAHAVKYAAPEEFPAEGELLIETEAQRLRVLALCGLASQEGSRYIYEALHISLKDPTAPSFYATDGRVAGYLNAAGYTIRLFDKETAGPHESPNIPSDVLMRFLAFKNTAYRVTWNAGRFRIDFSLEGRWVIYEGMLLEGKFPDISRVVPEITHRMPFDTAGLVAMKWVKNAPSHPITFVFEPTAEMHYAFTQKDTDGNIIGVHSWGAPDATRPRITGGINHTYLTAACKFVGPDAQLHLQMATAKDDGGSERYTDNLGYMKPIVIQSADSMALIMPMKV